MDNLIYKTCVLCDSTGFVVRERETRFKKLNEVPNQAIVECNGCGITTREPSIFSPNFEENAKVKVRAHEDYIGGQPDRVAPYIFERLIEAESKISGRMLLDIGCGSGALLLKAKERGWTCYGTEREPQAVSKMAKHDIKCFTGDLDDSELQSMRFDLIHMNHVLEHVQNPLLVLKSIESLLTKDGIAIIEVPNEFNAFTQLLRQWLNLDGSSATSYFQHEWFFSPKTLRSLSNKSGLRILKLHTPFRASSRLILDALRYSASVVGSGEIIEVFLTRPQSN